MWCPYLSSFTDLWLYPLLISIIKLCELRSLFLVRLSVVLFFSWSFTGYPPFYLTFWNAGVVVNGLAYRLEAPCFDFALGRNFFSDQLSPGPTQPQRTGSQDFVRKATAAKTVANIASWNAVVAPECENTNTLHSRGMQIPLGRI